MRGRDVRVRTAARRVEEPGGPRALRTGRAGPTPGGPPVARRRPRRRRPVRDHRRPLHLPLARPAAGRAGAPRRRPPSTRLAAGPVGRGGRPGVRRAGRRRRRSGGPGPGEGHARPRAERRRRGDPRPPRGRAPDRARRVGGGEGGARSGRRAPGRPRHVAASGRGPFATPPGRRAAPADPRRPPGHRPAGRRHRRGRERGPRRHPGRAGPGRRSAVLRAVRAQPAGRRERVARPAAKPTGGTPTAIGTGGFRSASWRRTCAS
jgi:hypothetical protein